MWDTKIIVTPPDTEAQHSPLWSPNRLTHDSLEFQDNHMYMLTLGELSPGQGRCRMVGGAPINLLFSLVISVYSLGRHEIVLWFLHHNCLWAEDCIYN